MARLHGTFSYWWGGWHDDGNKYMFLSVSFLCKSNIILPFIILHEVSKKGIDSMCGQSHWIDSSLELVDIWDIVNFRLVWIALISSNILCKSYTVPRYTLNMSFRNLVKKSDVSVSYFWSISEILGSILFAIKTSANLGECQGPMLVLSSSEYSLSENENMLFFNMILNMLIVSSVGTCLLCTQCAFFLWNISEQGYHIKSHKHCIFGKFSLIIKFFYLSKKIWGGSSL